MGFNQKWIIPDGKNSYGRVLIGDIDYDGFTDIVVRRNQPIKVMFYELDTSNQWQLKDSIVDGGDHLLWGLGDFDLDGLSDIVFQKTFGIPNVGIAVYESPDSFSYPTQEAWRDTVGPGLVLPICVYDIDKDGIPEIVKNRATPYGYLGIYESVGDNQYDLIFADNPDTSGNDAPAATIAFGDFDLDGKIEFVPAGGNEWYWIYECTGDNTYEKVSEGQLPTSNIRDCFAVDDADDDGKMEFVVKGFTFPDGKFQVFIFEAIGDNTYEIIDTLTFTGFSNSYYGGYSDVGDVDGDGIPEIALEGSYRVYMIEADSNNSFSVFDTLPGNASGSSVAIYDIDGNGLSEVVISGNNETRIYEYEEEGVKEAENSKIKLKNIKLTVFPNPFSNSTTIRTAGLSDYYTQKMSKIELKIYDTSGRLVKSVPLTSNTISLGSELSQGVYFLKLNGKPAGKGVKVR